MFSGYTRTRDIEKIEISDGMQPRFLNVLLKTDSVAVGKRLREMELDLLNIEVKAVRRHNVLGAQPSEEMLLQSGDVLLMLGLPEELQLAENRLHKGLE